MGIFNTFKNIFNKQNNEYNLISKSQNVLEKSQERLEQEKQLDEYKKVSKRINNSGLNLLLRTVEEKMSNNPYMTFDMDFIDIKDYINNNLTDKDKFLLLNKVYKFSKSNQEFTKYFAESHWYEYKEKQGYAYDNGKPLSVTTNAKRILFCAMYGDQVTIFENNPENKYYEQLKNADIKDIGTMFSEYQSDFLIINKNLSLSDPYVLKTILKTSDPYALRDYFNRTVKGKTFDQIYDEIGFSETAKFFRKAKECFDKYGLKFCEKLDEILPDKDRDKMLDNFIYSKTVDNKEQKVNEISKNIKER